MISRRRKGPLGGSCLGLKLWRKGARGVSGVEELYFDTFFFFVLSVLFVANCGKKLESGS